jgi:hypothetical protein
MDEPKLKEVALYLFVLGRLSHLGSKMVEVLVRLLMKRELTSTDELGY